MAIAFDAAVAFNSDLYTMNGDTAGVILTEVDTKANIVGPDGRRAIRSAFRAGIDARQNAAFRE